MLMVSILYFVLFISSTSSQSLTVNLYSQGNVATEKDLTPPQNNEEPPVNANHYMLISMGGSSDLRVVLETTSQTSWVVSRPCKISQGTVGVKVNLLGAFNMNIDVPGSCRGHNLYNPSGRVSQNDLCTIEYGDGSLSGNIVPSDRMTFSKPIGVNPGDFNVQSFCAVTSIPSSSASALSSFDGVLNQPPQINSDDQSLVVQMLQQGIIQQDIFCFIVNPQPDPNTASRDTIIGRIVFGEENPGCNNLNFMPMNNDYRVWNIDPQVIIVQGNEITCDNCIISLDSGTTDIYGPTDFNRKINNALGATPNGVYSSIGCSAISTLRPIQFSFDGQNYPMNPTDYILQAMNDKGRQVCRTRFVEGNQKLNGRDMMVFGTSFFTGKCICFRPEAIGFGLI